MDDKIYRGPGHPVGAHFHSGPPGKQGLPGVSPKVDMAYNEEEGTVVFTVTDGYGQREQTVPMAELMDDWMEHDSYEVIDQWLDDHPEATTTVQDGSITEAKLEEHLLEKIRVLGGKAIPNPSSGIFHDMLENIYSFMDHANEMFYGSLNGYQYDSLTDEEKIEAILDQTGAYNANPGAYRSLITDYVNEGRNPIICSWFVYAVTKGIRYEDSIFNGEVSNPKFYDWGFDWPGLEEYYTNVTDVEANSRPLASRMAHYCYDRGYTFTPNADWSNVRPGDVMFVSNSQSGDTWEQVGHLAIFLGIAAGRVYYAEVSSSNSALSEQYPVHVDRSSFNANPAKQVRYVARLPYNDGDRTSALTNIFANEESLRNLSTTVTGTGADSYFATARMAAQKEWKLNRWYTVVMSLELDFSTVASVTVMGEGSSTSVASVTTEQPNGLYVLRFFTAPTIYDRFKVNDSYATGLRLRVASSSSSTSTSVTLNWVACYEGYYRVGTDGFVPYFGT